jgi:hypothetical protein
MQAVEQLRGRGQLPASGPISVKSLLQRFQPSPRTSVRALLWKMLDGVAAKRPWAIILCRFKGASPNPNRETPIEQLYRGIFTPGTGGLVEYWLDASLGMIDIRGSRVFGWVDIDIARANANVGSGVARSKLIDAAVDAARRAGHDPTTGFHSQIAVYTENWSVDGVPAGLNWKDPQWGQFWIDGSADGRGRVCITPPHNGNITAHEMGHGFGMNHDLGADAAGKLVIDYSDPCCIMSQNNPFTHPAWMVAFGPALCMPHLVKQGWMFSRRLYYDSGAWQTRRNGISLPLAPITEPIAHANLGIKLAYKQGDNAWDYYLEYVKDTGWNTGLSGKSYLFIRRMVPHSAYGDTPAYLTLIEVPTTVGVKAEVVEPSGNVLFQVAWFDASGRILRVNAKKL